MTISGRVPVATVNRSTRCPCTAPTARGYGFGAALTVRATISCWCCPDYRIHFSPWMETQYVGEYYDDAASLDHADL